MRFLSLIALAISQLATITLALPNNAELLVSDTLIERAKPPCCTNPAIRSEWRTLTATQKKSYISAVKCLASKKAKSGLPQAVNRFDDHQAVHHNQTPTIHWVGHFILWHRYFVATYEKALRDECGYKGGQPYWNWSLDVSSKDSASTAVYSNPVFDPKTGFGGDGAYVEATEAQNPFNFTGRLGGGCVKDGPFTYPGFKVNVGATSPHCLTRDFVPQIMNTFAQQSLVDKVLAAKDYTGFAFAVENIPSFSEPNIHGSGHFGIGGALGTLGNAADSPGDPLFYLHHGNLDRIFTLWQSKDPSVRLNEVGGPIAPFDYGGKNVTLDFKIDIGKLAPSVTLKELLNTQGEVLCYKYANLAK